MGAFEGEFDPLPPLESTYVGSGGFAILGNIGCYFEGEDLTNTPFVFFANTNSEEGTTVSLSEQSDSVNSDAGGFSELGLVLIVETSLSDGTFSNFLTMPFTEEDLQGEDPLDVDLTFYDSEQDDWILASAGNVQLSPGHEGVVGDRIVTTGSQFSANGSLGDYGVFWNPESRTGVVWAKLDHDGEFGVGEALCPADLVPSDAIDGFDLLELLTAWGSSGSPADIAPEEGDGIVDVEDLLVMLGQWGACPP